MNPAKPALDDLRINRPTERTARPWLWAAWAIAFVLIISLVWWSTRPGAIEVHTTVARELARSNGEHTVLNASGYVTARRVATVSSKVTGKVVEMLIEEGMKVHEGQILARLDDTNVKASLAVTQAQLESAKKAIEETRALLKQAELEFRRTAELAKENIASQSDLDSAEANANSLKARLEKQETDVVVAEQQVALYQQQMDDLIIRAPFDGVVTTKDAQPGEMISPVSAGGGYTRTGIGTVVDMDSLEIEIDVNESYINRVKADQPVEATLDAYPDWKIPCKVIAVIPTADRQKSTVKVRVGFDQLDPRILPEMSVKVAFQDTVEMVTGHSVIVPKNSVLNRDGHDVVFIVHDGRAERRAVAVGSAQDQEAVLASGVSAGEKVIVDVPSDLVDGAKVREARM